MDAEGEEERGPLLCERAEKKRLEARNGADQFVYIKELVDAGAKHLRESHVLELQRIAVADIYPCAGTFRSARVRVKITQSEHEVVEAAFVRTRVQEAIAWVNGEGQPREVS